MLPSQLRALVPQDCRGWVNTFLKPAPDLMAHKDWGKVLHGLQAVASFLELIWNVICTDPPRKRGGLPGVSTGDDCRIPQSLLHWEPGMFPFITCFSVRKWVAVKED